jgi:hypothetical protein
MYIKHNLITPSLWEFHVIPGHIDKHKAKPFVFIGAARAAAIRV